MSEFELHTRETAPEEAKETLKGIEDKYGFVPNLFGKLAEAPQALQAYLAVNDLFEQTSFSDTERNVILIATSVYNECEFCVSVHSFIAKNMAKVDPEIVEALRNGKKLPDDKLNALAEFTRNVVHERGWAGEKAVERFLEAGYTKRQVLEVVLGVSLKTLSNYTNHLTGTPLNEQFEEERWKAPGSQAA